MGADPRVGGERFGPRVDGRAQKPYNHVAWLAVDGAQGDLVHARCSWPGVDPRDDAAARGSAAAHGSVAARSAACPGGGSPW